jgi:hypothetical protein
MKISEFFGSDYLKASDLRQEATVTIVTVEREEFDNSGRKDFKPVISFKGTDKQLVLNRTNFQTIADLHGQDTDDWINKPITIFPTQVDFRGKQVMAIRVKIQQPIVNNLPELKEEPPGFDITDDDIPF